MKKLLVLTVLVSVFISCEKESPQSEDTPDTGGNNGGGNNGGNNGGNGEQTTLFTKSFGSESGFEYGTGVVCTSDDGYYTSGDSIRKIDQHGQLEFGVDIPSSSISKCSDGNYIIAHEYDTKISKIDESGSVIWTKDCPVNLKFITETKDGGFIGIGINAIKFDSSGEIVWTQNFNTGSNWTSFEGYEIAETTTGEFVIAGVFSDNTQQAQFYSVYRLDNAGKISWGKKFSAATEGNSILATSDGGCISVGSSPSGWYDILVIKHNSDGTEAWRETYGNSSKYETGISIAHTSDGGFIIGGIINTSELEDKYNVYVLKIDSTGILQWSENYAWTHGDYVADIKEVEANKYVFTGKSNRGGREDEMYLQVIEHD